MALQVTYSIKAYNGISQCSAAESLLMAISALAYSANVTLKKALDQSCLRFRQLLSRMAPMLKHLKQATPRIFYLSGSAMHDILAMDHLRDSIHRSRSFLLLHMNVRLFYDFPD